MQTTDDRAQHWDDAYRQGDRSRSWFQDVAQPSLDMLDAVDVHPGAAVIDVGGGASRLAGALLERGHTDLTVLDVSAEALQTARHRLGAQAMQVRWLTADLAGWTPDRRWDLWHDRAVLHFFTDETDRRGYLRALDRAIAPGGVAVLGTFAPDGPERCSGLPVVRYDADGLAALLGDQWVRIHDARWSHTTPAGGEQPFTWAAFRRVPRG